MKAARADAEPNALSLLKYANLRIADDIRPESGVEVASVK